MSSRPTRGVSPVRKPAAGGWAARGARRFSRWNDRNPRTALTYLGIRLAVYLIALIPIVAIYSTKERGLLIAPPIGLIGAAATWFFLHDTALSPHRCLLYAAGVGIILGELTWALGYWAVVPFIGAAALWLALYVLSGVAEAAAARTLDRRVSLEYAGVSVLGLAVVLASGPWRA